ncbi:ATP-binding protein [Herbaspirillum sp. RTI4]|uniref:sensor histidine kinase n=1 Tax=Herbaspirillum sp. RTI4 TaxID=3048640 RepID=UPI002AB3CAD9|nr:ATP-binding protein [Herbaspirillum sp. RTI4]MDY7579156.1 ATP-binding protein [Herbaspirillum sp. RTI4]MEA9981265.1 ATP-binding protein [Herbaspirillum sp. RTI4]
METRKLQYFKLLESAIFSDQLEETLDDSAEFGRLFLRQGVPPEDIAEMHHLALQRLAAEHPHLTLGEVAAHLMKPLLEASMAYSLAFRQNREQQESVMARQMHVGRLEAIGTMAAGIAHDFNTLLGIINGYAELLLDEVEVASTEAGYLQQIIGASARANGLIKRMLAFARQAPIEPSLVDAVGLVKNALEMLKVRTPCNVRIFFVTDLSVAHVMADPLQIEQIIINLCVNAFDAMDDRGRLDIEIKKTQRKRRWQDESVDCFSLTVSDDGCGMSQDVQRRVLDPFYTTKEPGKGSGLGLSVVYGIVSDLMGEIQIHSEEGNGSSFHILLPLANPAQQPQPKSL